MRTRKRSVLRNSPYPFCVFFPIFSIIFSLLSALSCKDYKLYLIMCFSVFYTALFFLKSILALDELSSASGPATIPLSLVIFAAAAPLLDPNLILRSLVGEKMGVVNLI